MSTPTPRTDALGIQIYEEDVTGCSNATDYVPASFARTLETELAAALLYIKELEDENDNLLSDLRWANE